MIRDLCKIIKLAFTPVPILEQPKLVRKTVQGSCGEILHIQEKTHLTPPKDIFIKSKNTDGIINSSKKIN